MLTAIKNKKKWEGCPGVSILDFPLAHLFAFCLFSVNTHDLLNNTEKTVNRPMLGRLVTSMQCVFTYRSNHFSWSRQIGVKLGPADETELYACVASLLQYCVIVPQPSIDLITWFLRLSATSKIKRRLKVLIIPDTRNSADSPVSEVTVRSFDGAPDTKLLARYEVGLPHKFLFKGGNNSALLAFVTPSLGFAKSLDNRKFLPRNVPHVRQTNLFTEFILNHSSSRPLPGTNDWHLLHVFNTWDLSIIWTHI